MNRLASAVLKSLLRKVPGSAITEKGLGTSAQALGYWEDEVGI